MGWHCNNTIFIKDDKVFLDKMSGWLKQYDDLWHDRIKEWKDFLNNKDFEGLFKKLPLNLYSPLICLFVVSDIDFLSHIKVLTTNFFSNNDYGLSALYINKIHVPSNITKIEEDAFRKMSMLEEISGLEGVNDIVNGAFTAIHDEGFTRYQKTAPSKVIIKTNNKEVRELVDNYYRKEAVEAVEDI